MFLLFSSADRDALHFRFHLRRLLDAGVRPEEGLQVDHLHDPRLRQHLAEGHLPPSQRRLFSVALRHSGDCNGKVAF
jgi:hypothetical protein